MVELSCEGDVRFAGTLGKGYGGDSFNTAVAASRLGSSVAYITHLGKDPFAFGLKEMMLAEKINTDAAHSVSGQTGLYIVAATNSRRDFYYYRKGSAASTLGPDDIDEAFIKKARIVFATGVTLSLSDKTREAVMKAFKIARDNDVMTAFDPNYREVLWDSEVGALDALNGILPYVDVILPSSPDDTHKIIGFDKPDQIIDYFLFKGARLVVCKAGANGCYLGYKRQMEHVPAMTVKSVDTTGAGDAFNGGFLHGLCEQKSLMDCARLGNITAGLKVLNRGTASAMPYRDAVYNRVFSLTESL